MDVSLINRLIIRISVDCMEKQCGKKVFCDIKSGKIVFIKSFCKESYMGQITRDAQYIGSNIGIS